MSDEMKISATSCCKNVRVTYNIVSSIAQCLKEAYVKNANCKLQLNELMLLQKSNFM